MVDSTFENHNFAIQIDQSNNVEILNTEITAFQGDGIRLSDVQDILIEGNNLHSPLGTRYDLNHDDMIQLWAVGEDGISSNITIRGNIINSGVGSGSQSIFMRNEDVDGGTYGEERYFENIVIEDNIIFNSNSHGITVPETNGVTIRNNTLIYNSVAGGTSPQIQVDTLATGVLIEGNIAAAISAPTTAVISDNIIIDYQDASQDNSIENLFIDAKYGGQFDEIGLQIKPGSLADTMDVGAAASVFDETPDQLQAVYSSNKLNGTENVVAFDASLSANQSGYLTDTNATFLWDFGDGNTATGISVTHEFEDFDTFTVTLTVTSGGETDTYQSLLQTEDPVVFETNFEFGIQARDIDQSSYDTSVTSNSIYNFVHDEKHGTAYQIGDSYTGLGISRYASEMFYLDQMYISFDFKKDDVAGNSGTIFFLNSSYALYLTDSGSLKFNLTDADDTWVSLETADNILDAEWHNITIAYDTILGTTSILLDDQTVATTNAAGRTQDKESWGLIFGKLWSRDTADGLIDNITISTDPLGDDTVVIEATNANDVYSNVDADTVAYMLDGDDYARGGKEIYGGAGDDELYALSSGGTLYGGVGDDNLTGYGGYDFISGGAGDDTLFGGAGNDTIVADGEDSHIGGGGGYDVVLVNTDDDLYIDDIVFYGVEEIDISNGLANEIFMGWGEANGGGLIITADANDVINIDNNWATYSTPDVVEIDGSDYNHYSVTQGTWLDGDLYVSTAAQVDIV